MDVEQLWRELLKTLVDVKFLYINHKHNYDALAYLHKIFYYNGVPIKPQVVEELLRGEAQYRKEQEGLKGTTMSEKDLRIATNEWLDFTLDEH